MKGILLTIFLKGGGDALKDGKKETWFLFWVLKALMFCSVLTKALNKWWMLLGAAGKEDGFHSQTREWLIVAINSMQGIAV